MSNRYLDVALRLYLESHGLESNTRRFGQTWSTTTRGMERDGLRLDRMFGGLQSRLAQLGLGISLLANQRLSAQLDKDLTQIRQTAGGTIDQMRELRGAIFDMASDTGRPLESLKGGFNNLIQAGLQWKQALAAIRAINPASAVTGASEDVLAGGLTVAASSYGFDLSQPGIATQLLDQMTQAGRLGNAELENLSGIFARIGVNAKSANLQFADTLGYVEALSQFERNPERLSTLADSTLRLFYNLNYQKNATRATGVKFFNADKSARDPVDVLSDIAQRYQKLNNDQDRARFIFRAFGQTDLDTQRGLRTLLSGATLSTWREMAKQIRDADGTIARDLPDALRNAVDQSRRLKTLMREAGDAFAQPINRVFANVVEAQLKPVSEGGFGKTGGAVATVAEVAALGALALGGKTLLGRLGTSGRLLGDAVGTAGGIAQGQLVQQMGLGTPVFVTNWPGGGVGGGASDAAVAGAAGAAAARVIAGGGLAAAAMAVLPQMIIAAGSILIGTNLVNRGLNRIPGWEDANTVRNSAGVELTPDAAARLRDPSVQARIRRMGALKSVWSPSADAMPLPAYLTRDRAAGAAPPEMTGRLRIEITQSGRARVVGIDSSDNWDLQVQTGTGPLLAPLGQ
ncbi:phage tail tape measure protein [Solimonas flava]|uniref:phage tail tape measure protein n=1 Tax=Solimonas flava TaxID=415849 RepID=UPI0003F694E0|nr:phage tail tape measure protein [Solimonas flava]